MNSKVSNCGNHERGETRILHISDLHFHSAYDQKLPEQFGWIEQRLSERAPFDLVVVTGDIVDNKKELNRNEGLEQSFLSAEKYLRKICQKVSVNPDERLIIIPGNHDYRFWGFAQIPDLACRARAAWRDLSQGRLPETRTADRSIFEKTLGEKYFKSVFYREMRVAILSFDSNTPDWVLNLASGFVDPEQIRNSREILKSWKDEFPDEMKEAYWIALLHHHPLPLAESEKLAKERKITDFEEFLLLRNAGTFVKRCLESEIGLVLHGHKHCGGYWRPSASVGELLRSVNIVGAGSLGEPSPNNNKYSYNSISVFRDGYLKIKRIDVDSKGTFEEFLLPAPSYEEVRVELHAQLGRRRTRGKAEFPLRADEVVRTIDVDLAGDLKVSEEQSGLRSATGGPVDRVTTERRSPTRNFKHLKYESPGREVKVRGTSYEGTRYKYTLYFDPPIGSEKTKLTWQAVVQDGVVLSIDDQRALHGVDLEESWKEKEWVGFHAEQLYERATVIVKCPELLAPMFQRSLRLDVREYKNLEKSIGREMASFHVSFRWSDPTTATMSIYKPLPGYIYMLWWSLPKVHPLLQLLSVEENVLAGKVRARLYRAVNDSQSLDEFLQGMEAEIKKCECFRDRNLNDLVLALLAAATDEDLECIRTRGSAEIDVRGWRCKIGEGAAGLAFRRREPLYCNRATGLSESNQRTVSCDPKFEILYAVPLLVPITGGYPVGCLVILTNTEGSWLQILSEEPSRKEVGTAVLEFTSYKLNKIVKIEKLERLPIDPTWMKGA